MSSLEPFVRCVKPALDAFLRGHSKTTLANLETELRQFDWSDMKIFHSQILVPLVIKLEELGEESNELHTGTINCIRIVMSNLYLNDVKGLRTIIIIILRQIRDIGKVTTKKNLSEEIKLAAILTIAEALRRSTTDVLDDMYTNESVTLLGQLILTLVEFIEFEKYKQIIIASLQCLMVSFYVHDEADSMDVVLRSQVANTLFIFLPKVVSVLIKTSLADEKLGETIKIMSIKTLGRILCVVCEETNEPVPKSPLNSLEFKELVKKMLKQSDTSSINYDLFTRKKNDVDLEDRLKRIQGTGRSLEWFEETSRKLCMVLSQTCILRANISMPLRREYAEMSATLIRHCAHNLKDNFTYLLENIVAMAEDEVECIRQICQTALQSLQEKLNVVKLFDENCEILFDKYLAKLPRIINRCDEAEQYAEFMFIKGLFNNLSASKLLSLFVVPKNLDMFCQCLISIVDMKTTRDLLLEEYSLRQLNESDFTECKKLKWRQYKKLNSDRCIQAIRMICGTLGSTHELNHIVFEYMLDLLAQQSSNINEILLLMLWMATTTNTNELYTTNKKNQLTLVDTLMTEILNDKHWYLALQPDRVKRLHVHKPSDWFIDRTPGLYESAVEIRTQDYDSDEEQEVVNVRRADCVNIVDTEFNILHTCIVLDILGHCAAFVGENFDNYLFRCLHRVLLRTACSNSMVYEAAIFALTSIQKSLHYGKISQLIETHTDYITYHIKILLKRVPDSCVPVDILTVVLQFGNRSTLPHLENIFETIRDECTKSQHSENINSYLKVYNAFLKQIASWHITDNIETAQTMLVDDVINTDILNEWINALTKKKDIHMDTDVYFTNDTINNKELNDAQTNDEIDEIHHLEAAKPSLPSYIKIIKNILNQIYNFLICSNRVHQILALECLISGVPLLRNYEDELLPLVHLIWQPLQEKFRQKHPIVLYRCFSLLNILATYGKEFILKRSLDDIIPFLIRFLNVAAKHSASEKIIVQTQEYKLQLKLLKEFDNLIQSMQIGGRHLNDIAEIIALYLSISQPTELQQYAIQFFQTFRLYNGPLSYLIIVKRSHLKDYALNVSKLLINYGINK